MRTRSLIAVILCLALLIAQPAYVPEVEAPARAAAIALSAKTLSIHAGKTKVLKMKNTSKKVTWSISSGSNRISLKNKQKKQVTIVAKKRGTAKVKGVIKLSKKKKKIYTCTVKVLASLWECPKCGHMVDGEYCEYCGTKRPSKASASPSVSPTPTVSATPTPITPETMSDRCIVMVINSYYTFKLQMYANQAATDFYNKVVANEKIRLQDPTKAMLYDMGPGGDDERVCYLDFGLNPFPSTSNSVAAGEVFLYGTQGLKVSWSNHDTVSYPTRIGKVVEDVESLIQVLPIQMDKKTTIEFRQYM